MLLRQAAGTLSGTDVENLNVYADPNDPVTRLNSLKPRVIN